MIKNPERVMWSFLVVSDGVGIDAAVNNISDRVYLIEADQDWMAKEIRRVKTTASIVVVALCAILFIAFAGTHDADASPFSGVAGPSGKCMVATEECDR